MSAEWNGRRFWVTGAGGLLGSYFERAVPAFFPGTQITAIKREGLDLTDFARVARQFEKESPSVVIHCAALSRSPECQAHPEKARLLNVEVTRVLAELSANATLVFFSTDLVFDGLKGNYDEFANVNPQSFYGETKVEAEQEVLKHQGHLVIRTSLIAGRSPSGDRAFNEQSRLAWARGEIPRLFVDEYRSPIHADILTRATLDLLQTSQAGIFHVAGAERISRFQAGELLARRCPELNPRIQAASIAEYRGVPRPPDTTLNCARVQKYLSFRLPGLAEFLDEHPEAFF